MSHLVHGTITSRSRLDQSFGLGAGSGWSYNVEWDDGSLGIGWLETDLEFYRNGVEYMLAILNE